MMKIFLVFVGLFFVVFLSQADAFETICSASFDVDLDYTISSGKVLEMCGDSDLPQVFMTVESDVDSTLTVEIPRTMVYFVNQDCESQDLLVLINDTEVNYDVKNTSLSRIVTLNFPAGYNAIEFLGSYTLGDDVHKYCGVIYGYDSQYLSPKKQTDKGRSPENVRCNDGLELVFKKTDGSPACVTPETIEKLIQRNWAIS